jgi:hypothetical protein
MLMHQDNKLTASRIRAVAVAASVDPRTVRRYLDGYPVIGLCAERIEHALREPGREHLIREGGPTPRRANLPPTAA